MFFHVTLHLVINHDLLKYLLKILRFSHTILSHPHKINVGKRLAINLNPFVWKHDDLISNLIKMYNRVTEPCLYIKYVSFSSWEALV